MGYVLLCAVCVADYSSRNRDRERVCVCVDALMGFWPEQRVLMELMLGERKKEWEGVCSTVRKTETDVSTTSCFSQHFQHTYTHTHTHSVSKEGLHINTHMNTEAHKLREKRQTLSLSFSEFIHFVWVLKTDAISETRGLIGWCTFNLLLAWLVEQKYWSSLTFLSGDKPELPSPTGSQQ